MKVCIIMSKQEIHRHLFIAAVVFLVVDIIIAIAYFLWLYIKRGQKNIEEKETLLKSRKVDIKKDPFNELQLNEVEYTPDIFEIPGRTISIHGDQRNLRLKKMPTIRAKPTSNKINTDNYEKLSKRRLSSIPRLYFELFYDFRTLELRVSLKSGKYLPDYVNEQIIISVIMSHCFTIYHTSHVDGPNPTFNEELRFPLDSMQISSDPPVMLKFNVWTIDGFSRKTPFGYLEVSIEEVLTQKGVTPQPGEGIVSRNIILSESLTDESRQGEILISLSYLPGAQRVSIILSKAKDLVLATTDKDLQAKITLLHRDSEQKTFYTGFIEMSPNPEFHEEFVFNLFDFKNVNMDGIAISVELQSRHVKRFMKPRMIGMMTIGNSGLSSRHGREHWASMLTSSSSVSKWHSLEPCK